MDGTDDYLRCSECSASNTVVVYEILGQEMAFRRYNASPEHVWFSDDDENWFCPSHAHIPTDMDRDEFEQYRDNQNFFDHDTN
jgi:hypothetical protein